MTNNHPDVPQTIHEQEDLRVALLSQYADCTHFQQTVFRMAPGGGAVITLSESSKPRATTFSAQELDALCTAWTRYRADRQEAEQREKERIEDAIAMAGDLAATVPAIQIASDDSWTWWRVSCPQLDYEKHEYSPDDFLDTVKKVVALWKDHEQHLKEAHTLAEQIGLKISELVDPCTNDTMWTVHKPDAPADKNVEYVASTSEALVTAMRNFNARHAAKQNEMDPEQQAKKLAAAWPAIRIHERESEKEGDTDRWYVGVPDIAFGMWAANTPDGLLSAVEAAIQALGVHQHAEDAQ